MQAAEGSKKNIDAQKVFLMPVHTPLEDFAGQNQKLCEGCTFLAPLSNYVFQNRNQYFNVAPRKVRGRFAEHFRAMGQRRQLASGTPGWKDSFRDRFSHWA